MQKLLRFLRLGPPPVRGQAPPPADDQKHAGHDATADDKHAAQPDKPRRARPAKPNALVQLPLEDFIARETAFAWERLLDNIHPEGTMPGCVVASPSRALPDYWYQWTRDSAICERVVVERFVAEQRPQDWQRLEEYVEASRIMQHKQTVLGGFESGGLGEVKYYIDGEPYSGPWGRPQPDGPGSRIITLATLALACLVSGDESRVEYVKRALYPGRPSEGIEHAGVVKADLEYVATNWQKFGFDLWEEVSGRHFYTFLTLRTALFLGARLANQLGDVGASVRYIAAADEIALYLRKFWDDDRGVIKVTIEHGREPEAVGRHPGSADGPDRAKKEETDKEEAEERTEGQDGEAAQADDKGDDKAKKVDETHGKTSGLDVAVVLAVLHAGRGTSWSRVTTAVDAVADPPFETASKVLSTLVEVMDAMASLYPLNKGRRDTGAAVALGRYPEDVYDGVGMSIAHPWYLCTLGAAEFLYLLVSDLTTMSRSPTTLMLPLTPVLHSSLTRLLPNLEPPLPAVHRALGPSDPAFAGLVRSLLGLADSFVAVVQEYVGKGGHLSEQFERDGVPRGSAPHSGEGDGGGQIEDSKRDYEGGKPDEEVEMIGRGARDLSWSYAAWISCVEERRRARAAAERAGWVTAAGAGAGEGAPPGPAKDGAASSLPPPVPDTSR